MPPQRRDPDSTVAGGFAPERTLFALPQSIYSKENVRGGGALCYRRGAQFFLDEPKPKEARWRLERDIS